MDSTIFNRRTLLGSGALVGIGALLAACGQQANNEAAAAASAAPSDTASASAAASESPLASATPSTARGYSGGSKAPDGEYRPADKYGPAQNVPKPAEPEDGYREKSVEGMRKTLDAWVKWVSPTFKSELEAYEGVERLYQHGGWVIDGIESLTADGAPWSEDGETYFWKAYHVWEKEIYVAADGSWRSWTNEDKTNDTYKIELKHNGQKWELIGYVKVED